MLRQQLDPRRLHNSFTCHEYGAVPRLTLMYNFLVRGRFRAARTLSTMQVCHGARCPAQQTCSTLVRNSPIGSNVRVYKYFRNGRTAPHAAASEIPSFLSPELVQSVFSTFNGLLLVPWPLMVFFPNADFTKSLIKSNAPLYAFIAIYAYLFAAATAQSAASGEDVTEQIRYLFTEAVADPNKMASMFNVPGYAAQDWAHLCTWDYFVGQWIYLQGLEKGVFTSHSLFLTFNTGPFGLAVHYITEAITLRQRGGSQSLSEKIAQTREIAANQRQQLADRSAEQETNAQK